MTPNEMSKVINPLTGLSLQITESIKAEVKRFPEVRAAYLFGSRARGDFRDQSDIDITIDAPTMPASPLKSMVQRDAVVLWVL